MTTKCTFELVLGRASEHPVHYIKETMLHLGTVKIERVWANFTKINDRSVTSCGLLNRIMNRPRKLQCCIMSAHFVFINSTAVRAASLCYVQGNVSDINMLRDICLPNIKWSCSHIFQSVIVEYLCYSTSYQTVY